MEVIPFKVFMAKPSLTTMVDGGLVFFGGLGVCLIGLVILEKFGYQPNEKALRWLMWSGILASFTFAVLTNGLWGWITGLSW
ncbi:hypothetical protein [Peribacillus alkalitolerans]|uniref:hypothetical protein n=1 Tax=Peribacillus alkalitolerans TaxID=1550385 RepID=UPI0013D54348|nr:hypothetical protein [Peribacillus alkalitolerans]